MFTNSYLIEVEFVNECFIVWKIPVEPAGVEDLVFHIEAAVEADIFIHILHISILCHILRFQYLLTRDKYVVERFTLEKLQT